MANQSKKARSRPRLEQLDSIKAAADRLGVAVPQAKNELEADFILDELHRREKVARRKLSIKEQLRLIEERKLGA